MPYAATVTALTSLQVFRLGKPEIAAAVVTTPDLAAGLEALARRGGVTLRQNIEAAEQAKSGQAIARSSAFRTFLNVMDGDWSLR